jgi:hypothetical protein
MSMIAEHSVVIRATPDEVWSKLTDVARWPTWDVALEWVDAEPPFAHGSTRRWKAKGGIPLDLTVTSADPAKGYTSESRFFGQRMIFEHYFREAGPETVELTFRILIEGFGSSFTKLFQGSAIRRGLPVWMENFKLSLEESGARARA